jgi:hypothetical protein
MPKFPFLGLLLVSFLLSSPLIGAVTFKLESFSAEIPANNANAIRLKWVVSSDDAVASYILLRQTADQPMRKQIQELEARSGTESRKQYVFEDNTIYKTDEATGQQVTYYLQIKMKASGQIIEPSNNMTRLNYTSTSVRRTWGSIKAMFQ